MIRDAVMKAVDVVVGYAVRDAVSGAVGFAVRDVVCDTVCVTVGDVRDVVYSNQGGSKQ